MLSTIPQAMGTHLVVVYSIQVKRALKSFSLSSCFIIICHVDSDSENSYKGFIH